MKQIKKYAFGIILTFILAYIGIFFSSFIPYNLISGSVFALLSGMILNPYVSEFRIFKEGINFVSKQVLRFSIVLMGLTLSFSQVLLVGRYSLIVMVFTLFTAFIGGWLLGKLFGMNWKLSGLISAGTGICGGSAIAAIAPVIEADIKDIAYAISATFIFDILMVILFPIAGRYFGMSDMGYGLWTGTAVNDTSAVVAAGYAFSDIAGGFAVIVKLTRTLSIIPAVLIFSIINKHVESKKSALQPVTENKKKVSLKDIFPYFILLFLIMVGIKSTGLIPEKASTLASSTSKYLMVMALGAIGLRTNFREVARSGFKPMLHGFIISMLVVTVSFLVQMFIGQL